MWLGQRKFFESRNELFISSASCPPAKVEESCYFAHSNSSKRVHHIEESFHRPHKEKKITFALKVQLHKSQTKAEILSSHILRLFLRDVGLSVYVFRGLWSLTILHHSGKCELGLAPRILATRQHLPSRAPGL